MDDYFNLSIRVCLEKDYGAPISSKKLREHYINDRKKIYLTSGILKNGNFYVVESIWKQTDIYSYKLWYVFQKVNIVTNLNFIEDRVNKMILDYGPCVEFQNEISAKYNKMSTLEKKMAENFNLVIGPILKEFKNNNLRNSFVVNNDIKNKINITAKYFDSYCLLTIKKLESNQTKWIYSMCKLNGKSDVELDIKENVIKFKISKNNIFISGDPEIYINYLIKNNIFENLVKLLNFVVTYSN